MNKTIAITAIALVSMALGMSAIAPAMAVVYTPESINPVLYTPKGASCEASDMCLVIIDADNNGCDDGDTIIALPYKAVKRLHIPSCP